MLLQVNMDYYACEFAFMDLSSYDMLRRWSIDSWSSRHLTNQREHMFNYRTLDNAEFVNSAFEGGSMKVVGIGNLRVIQVIDGSEKVITLKDVGYSTKCVQIWLGYRKRNLLESEFNLNHVVPR